MGAKENHELFLPFGVYRIKPMHRRSTMKMRYGLVAASVITVSIFLTNTPAWSGSKQQYRWEGVAIGIGAAIAGSAIIHHSSAWHPHPSTTVVYAYRHRGYHPHAYRLSGPWRQKHRYDHRFGNFNRFGSWSGKWGDSPGHHGHYDRFRGHPRHGKANDRSGRPAWPRDKDQRSGYSRGHGHH